ncbi:hypothetical protein TUSST3_25130 [Streptomyces sp. TUS-ST3]|jgi:hypothetical protein|uniref:hypothetical protein n=1 Tax=Streptomyces sp. TUS-ST3 TaxID=3025591 RepID=UPI00235B5767|nr:hypothetical protein [Streptomyces sp. TUS-ST3]GLP65893.1 hypothetical protein TUSST3_25130 [Streptomyces sp. TUS-ST3]
MLTRKLASAFGAVAITAGGLLAVAAPANAAVDLVTPKDPTCGYLVTPQSVSNGAKIYSEAPKCGQKVRAVANCLSRVSSGAGKVYGNALSSSGYSTAQCGSTFDVTQEGYQKYVDGSWQSIYWYNG